MIIQEPVKAAIWHCLNHYDYKDAVFLAERLCAEVETDETVFILATSYYRSQEVQQALWLLKEKSRRSPQCRYLQARCAFQLKHYSEAETALSECNFGEIKDFDDITKEFGEIACFAIHLIAQICVKTERTKLAIIALNAALKLNPFLWHAFTELCLLDETTDSADIFNTQNDDIFKTCQSNVNFMHTTILFNGTDSIYDNAIHDIGYINPNSPKLETPANLLCTPTENNYQTPNTPINHMHNNNNQNNNNNNNNTTNTSSNCSNNNFNTSYNILLGKANGGSDNWEQTPVSITNQQQQHDVAKLQAAHTLANMDEFATAAVPPLLPTATTTVTNNVDVMMVGAMETPFRRNFKYLQSACPITPSFGVLPLSPGSNDSPLLGANATTMTAITLPKPKPSRRQHRNKDMMDVANGSGDSVGNIMTPLTATQSLSHKQPQVFTPTIYRTPINTNNNNNPTNNNANASNNNNNNNNGGSSSSTTNTSNSNAAAVRRSSRLFGNNVGNSVKENSKTQQNIVGHSKFAAPRSPPRKTKPRIPKICLNNELIGDQFSISLGFKKIDKLDKRKLCGTNLDKMSKIHEQYEQTRATRLPATQLHLQQQQQAFTQNIMNTTNFNNINNINPIDEDISDTETNEMDSNKVLLNNNLNNSQTIAHEILQLKKHSVEGLMFLLRELGTGYKLLFTYNCKRALEHLETQVPLHHFNSCWVQSLIGVAHYELREYENAIKVFKSIRDVEPYRLQYMELYSSSLWHLQRDSEMSALSRDLINLNKMSPVTWCVAGNCFSLHKEHETAIKFFKRAVQVDPDFVYSYTLLGHELLLAEELDKAMGYFRYAIMRDPRHYYAWFGMGTIYSKQEKYELAEIHYVRALKINPQNSVILVHIGAMQYFMGKKEKALSTFNAAAALEPRDPLSRFHRASIYFSMGRHKDALDELEELKKLVPKESVVFYLIGKIHKQLGHADLALMHFSWATDLDPKGANNQIKDVFDSMTPQSCCGSIGDEIIEEVISESCDESNQPQPDLNYDSDVY